MKNGRMQKSLYKCNRCKDTGWVEKTREDGSKYFVSCSCREKEKVDNQWRAAGITLGSSSLTFNNFKVWNNESLKSKETAIAFFNDFINIKAKRQNSILFTGQVGSGKTHLSIALAINLLSDGISVVYMPYRDCITKIKQNILDQEYYRKVLSKYQTCQVLLIDDLYKGKISKSDINIMFEIVNYRYINHLPLIVSSEFMVDEILSFDEAVGSRIYEMCKDYIVTMSKGIENNYRLKNER